MLISTLDNPYLDTRETEKSYMTTINNQPYIYTRNLSRSVSMADENIQILDKVDFKIEKGQSVAIVGESGSGKSTLLGLLAGLDTADSGTIMIDGQDIAGMDEDGRARFRSQYMGFVFQSFQLMPTYSALENVMLPLELIGSMQNARDQATRLLDRVSLSHRLNHYPHQLSGGEQQRVALARAFINTPQILFADEPTGNLDSKTSELIIDLMFELNSEHKTTLVLVTHETKLANLCSRIFELDNGAITVQK